MNPANESRISRALREVIESDSQAARQNLYSALTHQRLIVPLAGDPNDIETDAWGRLKRKVYLNFFRSHESDGRDVLAVFTNFDRMKKWNPEVPTWIAVDTPSICRMAIESGLCALRINPGSNLVELNLAEMNALAELDAGGQLT